jgi:chorismate synthase
MIIFVIMAGNVFGEVFRLITYGESHGEAIGGVIEGCPAGLPVDLDFILGELQRRKPGNFFTSSQRKEPDIPEILSGVKDGITLGSPIGFLIRNKDHHPEDYLTLEDIYRPSHADFTVHQKYGIRDARGGGRISGRETAARIVGGAFARILLQHHKISLQAVTSQIGPHALNLPYERIDLGKASHSSLYCPDENLARLMQDYLVNLEASGDTTGGKVTCVIKGVPAGLGEPVFDKLHADLGKAMLSIGTCRGFEIGTGFNAAAMRGSQHNDPFISSQGKIKTKTNHSGGIQGGISNGMDIWFSAVFKPIPSIHNTQKSTDLSGNEVEITLKGRHDVCVIPKVVPVVEAMAALVIADHLLRHRSSRT